MENNNTAYVSLPVSVENVGRINGEIAHHNPDGIPGNQMLDEILNRYFAMADILRK